MYFFHKIVSQLRFFQGIYQIGIQLYHFFTIKTIKHGNIIHHLLYKQDGIEYPKQEEIPFYEKQTRLVLKNCDILMQNISKNILRLEAINPLQKFCLNRLQMM